MSATRQIGGLPVSRLPHISYYPFDHTFLTCDGQRVGGEPFGAEQVILFRVACPAVTVRAFPDAPFRVAHDVDPLPSQWCAFHDPPDIVGYTTLPSGEAHSVSSASRPASVIAHTCWASPAVEDLLAPVGAM